MAATTDSIAQIEGRVLKEDACKCAHQCGWAYLGLWRYLTSKMHHHWNWWENGEASSLLSQPHLLLESQGDFPGNQVDLSMKCEYCKGGRLHSSLFFFFFSCTCVHIKYPTNIYWAFTTHQPLCEGCNGEQDTCHSLHLQDNIGSRKLVYRLLSRVRWRAFRPRVKNRLLFMNWVPFVLLFANRVHLVQTSFSHYKTCGQRQLVIWIRGK